MWDIYEKYTFLDKYYIQERAKPLWQWTNNSFNGSIRQNGNWLIPFLANLIVLETIPTKYILASNSFEIYYWQN